MDSTDSSCLVSGQARTFGGGGNAGGNLVNPGSTYKNRDVYQRKREEQEKPWTENRSEGVYRDLVGSEDHDKHWCFAKVLTEFLGELSL